MDIDIGLYIKRNISCQLGEIVRSVWKTIKEIQYQYEATCEYGTKISRTLYIMVANGHDTSSTGLIK